jgi:hypothetical protein
MKYVYAFGVAAALMVGCCAVQTQSSTSHDIAQMMDFVQRGVALSMTVAVNVGTGDESDQVAAKADINKYEVAENRVENGFADTDMALADGVS